MLDKLKKLLINKYMIALYAGILGYYSTLFFGDDNPVEEVAEEIIKVETGLDIDLTPHSRESIINNETR
jgi:hypothetical protein